MIECSSHSDFYNGKAEITIEGSIAEKKPDYPIYTDDDCKIILLKDETNA